MMITISTAISKEIKGTWGSELTQDKVGLPVIKTNNLNYDGTIDLSNVSFRDIEPSALAQLGLMPGDLLIEKSGGTKTHSVGYVAFFDGPENTYVANNFILTIRPNPSVVLPRFLFHQLRYKYESGQFDDCYNKTTGIQNLKTKVYLSKHIALPTMERQVFISNELDLITREINDSKEQIKLLNEQVKSLFNEMFGDPRLNNLNWPKAKLGTLCEITRGGSPRPIAKYLGGNVPWIKIGDATDGDDFYITHTAEHIIPEGIKRSRYIKSGSLVFANCGVSLGFCRILKLNGCIHDGWLAFQNISPKIEKVFLLATINELTEYFRGIAPGGTQPNLNTKIMSEYEQILPPLELQKSYIERRLAIDKLRFT